MKKIYNHLESICEAIGVAFCQWCLNCCSNFTLSRLLLASSPRKLPAIILKCPYYHDNSHLFLSGQVNSSIHVNSIDVPDNDIMASNGVVHVVKTLLYPGGKAGNVLVTFWPLVPRCINSHSQEKAGPFLNLTLLFFHGWFISLRS